MRGDLVGCLIEGKMSGFQDVYFCLGYIVGAGSGARDGERGVVFSPDDQGRRLYLAKPFLPKRIRGDVVAVIQKQRGLNVGLSRPGEKGVFVGPRIRIVAIGMWAGPEVALARHFEEREVGP